MKNKRLLLILLLALSLVFPTILWGADTASIIHNPKFLAIDANGDPRSGAKLYTYETGTDTPKATWKDYGKVTPNANPVILNSNGEADIWLDSSEGAYRFRLDGVDDVTLWTVDNVQTAATLLLLGITATADEINTIADGITATAAEVNTVADGISATAAEINTVAYGDTAKNSHVHDPVVIGLPRGLLKGLTLVNGTDSDHDIDILAGQCRNDNLDDDIILESTLVKQLDATWVEGTNQGGLDVGTIASSTKYYIYLIYNPTTEVTDALFTITYGDPTMPEDYTKKRLLSSVTTDGSANIISFEEEGVMRLPRGFLGGMQLSSSGVNVTITVGECRNGDSDGDIYLASEMVKYLDVNWVEGTTQGGLDTGAIFPDTEYFVYAIYNPTTEVTDILFTISYDGPTMPTDYTEKRMIGSIFTNSGSTIIPFSQEGDNFLWLDPPLDLDISDQGVSAVTRTLSVATHRKVQAILNVKLYQTGASETRAYFSSLDVNDEEPSHIASPLATLVSPWVSGMGSPVATYSKINIRTNIQGQIRTRSTSANTEIMITTLGYIDRRGQDD